MRIKEKTKLLSLFLVVLLIVSASSMVMLASGEAEKEIMLVSFEKEDDLYRIDSVVQDIIEIYPNRVLVSISENERDELFNIGFSVQEIPNNTVLTVKEYTFDINEGYPDFPDELLIDEYEPGTDGIYLVHMLGPVHSSWRQSLLDMGVEVINYVPNYAYEVRMTPELADEVEDLYFVDWVGIYQPGFKLARDIQPGVIEMSILSTSRATTLSAIDEKATILSYSQRPFGAGMIIHVDDTGSLIEIANLKDVYFMSNYLEPKLHDEMTTQIIGGGLWMFDNDDNPDTPYRVYGLRFGSHVNQYLGLSGDGVVIAIADTGIGNGNPGDAGHLDFTGRVIGGHGWGDDSNYWADGHGHGTHVTGSAAGNTFGGTRDTMDFAPYYVAQGLAHEANIFAEKIFSDEGVFMPDNYYEIVQYPKQYASAYVHSNSWGGSGNGRYTLSSSEYDMAVRDANNDTAENEPMVITTSAGNDGPDDTTIGSPATGKNVISVGATQNYNPDAGVFNPDMIVGFSSRGWTNDSRVKPDVVAPGQGIVSTYPDGGYATMSGTSMSNPAVAGAAALIVEWYEDLYGVRPSPAMVKAMLINSAYDIDDENGNTDPIPNRDEGWGMVFLPALMDARAEFMEVDETELIETGELHEYNITWEDDLVPLKITLTWTDKYALSGDTWTLKNNLDLEVIAPDGETYYRGNAFPVDAEGNSASSFTSPNTDSMPVFDRNEDGWDDVNNVLNVYIPAEDLEFGEYTVRVIGTNVPEDANNDGDANQDYALFISNTVDPEGRPHIELTYPEGGEVWNYDEWETITWETAEGDNPISTVDLMYTLDEGLTWSDIAIGIPDDGSYLWQVPDQPTHTLRVRAIVNDDGGLARMHTSGVLAIIGSEPASPSGLGVEHYLGPTPIIIDDFQDGDYTSDPIWTAYSGEWSVEQEEGYHWLEGEGTISTPFTEAYGRWEWDFQFTQTEPDGGQFQVMRFYFIQDTPDPGDSSFSGYYIIVTGELTDPYPPEPQINLWRIDDGDTPPEGTLISTNWDGNTEWNTLAVDRDEDGNFAMYLNDDILGIAEDNTYNTTNYIGFRNEATSPDYRHRVGEVRTIVELEGDDHNRITWDKSIDDGTGRNSVEFYDIERSYTGTGDWYSLGTISADGSADYSFTDLYAGNYDNVAWWYRIRAVDIHGLYDDPPMTPVQEPITTEVTVNIVSPEDDALFNTDSVSIHWTSTGDIEFYHLYLNDDPPIYKLEQNHNFINMPDGHHTVTVEAYGGGEPVSDTVNFTIDTTPPPLEITSECGGITFDETFTIDGVTEPTATVEINGNMVDVNATTGEFDYTTSLVDGLNLFHVTAVDGASNEATTTVYALYMPDIPALYDAISALQSDVSSLQADVSSLQADVNSLQAEITSLWDEIDVLNEDLADMMEYFDEEMVRLDGRIDELDSDLNTLNNRLTTEINALEEAIENNRVELIDIIDSRIANITEEISELENTTRTIRNDLDDLNTDMNTFRAEQQQIDDDQDSDISTATNMALVGIFMAIIALILVIIYAVMSKGGSSSSDFEEEPFEEEEDFEETLFEDDEF